MSDDDSETEMKIDKLESVNSRSSYVQPSSSASLGKKVTSQIYNISFMGMSIGDIFFLYNQFSLKRLNTCK